MARPGTEIPAGRQGPAVRGCRAAPMKPPIRQASHQRHVCASPAPTTRVIRVTSFFLYARLFSLGRHIVRYYPGDVHQPVPGLQKSRLAGTGVLLMTNIYLAAHHEIGGRPHRAPRAAGTGLAGPARRAYYRTWRPRSPSIAAPCSRSAGGTATWLHGTRARRTWCPDACWIWSRLRSPDSGRTSAGRSGRPGSARRARLRRTLLEGRRAQRPLPL